MAKGKEGRRAVAALVVAAVLACVLFTGIGGLHHCCGRRCNVCLLLAMLHSAYLLLVFDCIAFGLTVGMRHLGGGFHVVPVPGYSPVLYKERMLD